MLLETFLGGIVEIVLFMVLLARNNSERNDLIPVIQAAILGSILANLLLCLGFCFFVGGMNRDEQQFDEAISEVGSGLMLVAGFGLLIPSAFTTSLTATITDSEILATLPERVLKISRATAVVLLIAYLMYVYQLILLVPLRPSDPSFQLCLVSNAYASQHIRLGTGTGRAQRSRSSQGFEKGEVHTDRVHFGPRYCSDMCLVAC